MPFMVIYSTSDGASCHEQADAIDEAALYVERLRNQEGIEEIRIYRMEEISFAFRPYYKVELGMPERQATTPPPEVVGSIPSPPVAHEPVVLHQPDPPVDTAHLPAGEGDVDTVSPSTTDANARRGLFGR
jgi:hypothetical protein